MPNLPMLTLTDLQDASRVIQTHLAPSAQIAWPLLSQRTGAEVWVKHENHLPTGAFKVRGGLVLRRSLASRERGHSWSDLGHARQSRPVARLRRTLLGFEVKIVVPHGNSAEKNAAMAASVPP